MCAEPEQLQPLSPPECKDYLQPDNIRPFSLKHAKQQASIVGHLKQAGLLQVWHLALPVQQSVLSPKQQPVTQNAMSCVLCRVPKLKLMLSLELAKATFQACWQMAQMQSTLYSWTTRHSA